MKDKDEETRRELEIETQTSLTDNSSRIAWVDKVSDRELPWSYISGQRRGLKQERR
jgi:hypothetical protein